MSGNYHQNVYYVKNKHKYIGLSDKIFYMSGWEYQFFLKLEDNPNVIKWSANTFSLDYYLETDGKWHKYYLDVYAEISNNGKQDKYLIEIKPDAQVREPLLPKKKHPKAMEGYKRRFLEYRRNLAKWRTAQAYSSSRGMTFLLITEKAYYIVDHSGHAIKIKESKNF